MGYSTDLTDYQWSLIEHIFTSKKGQHFAKHLKRELEADIIIIDLSANMVCTIIRL